MADEHIIKLLEEIRDLQKLHVENYKDALRNQRESIEFQKHAVRRQRIVQIVLFVVVLVFLGFLAWTSR